MDLIQNYSSSEEENEITVHCIKAGGRDLEEFLYSHALLSKINLHTDKQNVNKTYASLKVDSEEKEDFSYISHRGEKDIINKRSIVSQTKIVSRDSDPDT